MELAWQGSLLAAGVARPDPSFSTETRHHLGQGAWVDHVPGWVEGADTLLADLLDATEWRQHQVVMYGERVPEPRLTGRWDLDPRSPDRPCGVGAIADALSSRYGTHFATMGTNLYRDGRDSVAWHGDRVLREQGTALVAVVSLGATRRFLLRPRLGGPSVRFDPGPGDLLVMGGTCQRTWQHCVPKTATPVGPRLSLTMRPGRRRPRASGGRGV